MIWDTHAIFWDRFTLCNPNLIRDPKWISPKPRNNHHWQYPQRDCFFDACQTLCRCKWWTIDSAYLPATHRLAMRVSSDKATPEEIERMDDLTIRSIALGLFLGALICFANTYSSLQAGFVNSMTIKAGLIVFGGFQLIKHSIKSPFTRAENALVVAVSWSFGTMPWTIGLNGIVPAFQYLVIPEEGGPFKSSTWQLLIWASGLSILGITIAPTLRDYFLFRQCLGFPVATSAATMLGLLYENKRITKRVRIENTKFDTHLGSWARDNLQGTTRRENVVSGDCNGVKWRLSITCISVASLLASL